MLSQLKTTNIFIFLEAKNISTHHLQKPSVTQTYTEHNVNTSDILEVILDTSLQSHYSAIRRR